MDSLPTDIGRTINNYDYSVNYENLTKLNKTFTRLFEKDQLGKVYLDKIKEEKRRIANELLMKRFMRGLEPWYGLSTGSGFD